MFIIANGIKYRDTKVYDFKFRDVPLPFRVNASKLYKIGGYEVPYATSFIALVK